MYGCTKIRYPNRKEAKAGIAKHNKIYKNKAKAEYKCPYCGFFHITSVKEKKLKSHSKYHKQRAAKER